MCNLEKSVFSLSVIIPNYNKAKYLRACLDSVLKQTFLPNEVIIVDDCSTDESRSIISEYASRYANVKPLFLQKNGGVSNARNRGLDMATSKYVTYIDSDDFYYNKDKLKNEMTLIRKYASLGKDIVAYSVFAYVDMEGNLMPGRGNRKWSKVEFIKGKALVELVSMVKQSRIPRDYCIKKNVIQSVGAYSFYKNFYEDLDLLMRIAENGIEYYCTYEYGTAYRQTVEGLSKKTKSEHISTVEEIKNTYYQKLSSTEKLECNLRMSIHKIYIAIKTKILIPIRDYLRKVL